jgi:hypothetical protein
MTADGVYYPLMVILGCFIIYWVYHGLPHYVLNEMLRNTIGDLNFENHGIDVDISINNRDSIRV